MIDHVRLRLHGEAKRALLALSVATLWVVAGEVDAQPTDEAVLAPSRAEQRTRPSADESPVRESELDVWYLPGADGQLRRVIDLSYEELLELLQDADGRGRKPEYSLKRLEADAKYLEGRVEIDLRIEMGVSQRQWVEIPLRVPHTVALSQPSYEGDGEAIFVRNRSRELDAWVRGSPESSHVVHLRLSKQVVEAGDRRRLTLVLPRALQSQLALDFGEVIRDLEVSDGVTIEATDAAAPRSAMLRAVGGVVDIRWRRNDERVVEERPALDVDGKQLIVVGDRRIRVDADLTVSARRRPFDTFVVTLPAGFSWLSRGMPGCRVARLSDAGDEDASKQRLRVTLDEPTSNSFHLRLEAERTYEVDPHGTQVPLAGFQVADAVTQGGHVAIVVEAERRVAIAAPRHVWQVDTLPANLDREGVDFGFEYYKQPFELDINISPPLASVSVKPSYAIEVSPREATLRGTLKYVVSGSNVDSFAVDLADWQLDPKLGVVVNEIRRADARQDAKGRLVIPVPVGAKGEVLVELTARRSLAPQAGQIRLPVPVPLEVLPSVASLRLVPAENVRLTPRRDKLVGLSSLRSSPGDAEVEGKGRQLLFTAEGDAAVFVGEVEVMSRSIAVELESELDLRQGTLVQSLAYDIAFESADRLRLQVPHEHLRNGPLGVFLDGRPVEVSAAAGRDAEGEPVLLEVRLPSARLGRAQLEIRSSLLDVMSVIAGPDSEKRVEVPLVKPLDGKVTRNELRLVRDAGLDIQMASDNWREIEDPSAAGGASSILRFDAKPTMDRVPLIVRMIERSARTPILVRRGWIWMWLGSDARRARATFVVRSRDREVRLGLPAQAEVNSAIVYVDGQEVAAEPERAAGAATTSLVVALPEKATDEFTLDLQYTLSATTGGLSGSLGLPGFDESVVVEDLAYVELMLPGREQVISTPRGLTAAWDWEWDRFGWTRVPHMTERELARWSGSHWQDAEFLPQLTSLERLADRGQVARYLFTTMSVGGSHDFTFVSRGMATLLGAGLVLVLGLAFLYVSPLRRPAALLTVAVLLLAAGYAFPDLAIVLARTTALGITLVALAALLQQLFKSPLTPQPTYPEPMGSSARLPSTQFHQGPANQGDASHGDANQGDSNQGDASPGMSSQRTTVSAPQMSVLPSQPEPASSKS
ncbi:MAG: hypothetical protein DWQ31_11315 [Planctomycetota bacterium]|nr:MAG: hypothetical protein DWQ31_11315 [Planctomycetota bacterium]REJ98533.1 MAG: hypothetical protein DWQ35_00590 [Planctomycetota bacterium]